MSDQHPSTLDPRAAAAAVHDVALIKQAFNLANRAVVVDIESEALRLRDRPDGRWYDLRPMLNEHEHCPEFIDMAREAIAYGLAAGVLTADPHHAHIVRINQGL